MRRRRDLSLLGVLLALAASPALAAGTGGCESFDFPLTTELQWMKAQDAANVASGATLEATPAGAIGVALVPTAEAKFTVPPTGKAKNKPENSFAGLVTVAGITEPGLYQVSLSGPGWIDVIQDGVALKSGAHTGKSDCEGLRKSVRFDLAGGPVVIQLSDVPAAQIRLTVRKVD